MLASDKLTEKSSTRISESSKTFDDVINKISSLKFTGEFLFVNISYINVCDNYKKTIVCLRVKEHKFLYCIQKLSNDLNIIKFINTTLMFSLFYILIIFK